MKGGRPGAGWFEAREGVTSPTATEVDGLPAPASSGATARGSYRAGPSALLRGAGREASELRRNAGAEFDTGQVRDSGLARLVASGIACFQGSQAAAGSSRAGAFYLKPRPSVGL